MKRFWNWKTALVGVTTALLLTAVSVLAYVLYCHYLDKTYRSTGRLVQEIEVGGIEESGVSVVTMMGENGNQDIMVYGTPSTDEIREICGYHYVLYKELCDNKLQREGKEPYLSYQDLLFGEIPELVLPPEYDERSLDSFKSTYESMTSVARENVDYYLSELENRFSEFNKNYDYWVLDQKSGEVLLTNTETHDAHTIDNSQYAYLFRIDYDEHGVPSISDQNFNSGDDETFRKDVNSVLHEKSLQLLGDRTNLQNVTPSFMKVALEKSCKVKNPAGCSLIVGITVYKFQTLSGFTVIDSEWEVYFGMFASLSVRVTCLAIILVALFSGLFYLNSRSEEKRAKRILARAPIELVVALVVLLLCAEYPLRRWMTGLYLVYERDYVSATLFAFFVCIISWYVGGCVGEIRILGFKEYFRKRFLFLILWRAFRGHVRKLYDEYRSVNLGQDLRKKILRLLIINALVVSACCLGWIFGLVGILVYTIFLYFLIMQYVIAVQKDYQELRRMTKEMAEGNLKYEPQKSLGLFEPAKKDLVEIRNGFDKAVQEEVKSHKLKTELITNVSHDLKTPLTAIITYVNLLKDKNLTQEQIDSYVETLDKKSLRLKRLIEDLFEVSKANSGNIQLNLQNCDLANLIKQCFYEAEDKLAEKNLTTRLTMPENKVVLRLDSEKTYRIYENLFTNVVKYAMAGTRVYVSMTEDQDNVSVTIKNITEAELYVPAQELAERFVRGDASRGSVEGSGLGLAIVRSFTELQGGKFEIEVDGDLFKVTTIWRKNNGIVA